MSKISIVNGDNRARNIAAAIKLIKGDIEKAIRNKKSKQLFIKINAIDTNFPLACTHVDALDSVLNIFYNKFNNVIVGDNTFVFGKNKGGIYRQILKRYPKIKLSDLTEFETENMKFKRLDGNVSIGKISLLPKKSFTISLAVPKTHDTFVYTGCLKNMFGCVIKNRGDLHAISLFDRLFLNKYIKSNKIKWDNLVNVINKTRPDLCILDGYNGMEGDGPLLGTKVKLGIAMCSLDGVALDKLASKICGFDYVPYLNMLSRRSDNIKIVKEGFNNIGEISRTFKPHYLYNYQINTSNDSLIPLLDIRFIISILKRSYRIKDKIIAKLKG